MLQHRGEYPSNGQSRIGVERLTDCSHYPGLPTLDSSQLVLQLYEIPLFEPVASWNLYRITDERFLIRRVEWDSLSDFYHGGEQPSTFGVDAHVAVSETVRYMLDLEMLLENEGANFQINSKFSKEARYGVWRKGNDPDILWWGESLDENTSLMQWFFHFRDYLGNLLPR